MKTSLIIDTIAKCNFTKKQAHRTNWKNEVNLLLVLRVTRIASVSIFEIFKKLDARIQAQSTARQCSARFLLFIQKI